LESGDLSPLFRCDLDFSLPLHGPLFNPASDPSSM
jgi:hypothetical protein